MAISVKVEQTPNPNALKFTANKTIFEGTKSYSYKKGDTPDHPLAAALIQIEGVDNVFGYQDFITVNKTFEADWDTVLPQIEKVFENEN
ncbi:scaffolding protein [Pueribacillus theae]|uniref:Scaffolding protein n=1 Tax=Pueribacillus theae TaxID=2171751 RepID=A0A2U1JXU0_9BACI|nr:NifU N-terminal domain-containing protein [Pueribacillus theae]PWA10036.1 scaffolding protein [Pueribacillus theae]